MGTLRDILANVGAILTLVSALTVLCVVRLWLRPGDAPRPGLPAVACAVVYMSAAAWMFYYGLGGSPHLVWWLLGLVLATTVGYVGARRFGPASRS